MSRRGILITFEGIDGAGKTTQITRLQSYLTENGYRVKVVREPGGTDISEKIRELLLNPELGNMHPYTELLLYSAARAQLVQEVIVPELNKGTIVLGDRFVDSTIVYQGYSREIPSTYIDCVNSIATGGLSPDLTFIMDIPVEESLFRLKGHEIDRLEAESSEFKQKIRNGFLELGRKYPERCVIVDATKAKDQVFDEILKYVREKIELETL